MKKTEWIRCPSCGHKTRIQIRADTLLYHLPLFCPKCKLENLIDVRNQKVYIVAEPDAKTQC